MRFNGRSFGAGGMRGSLGPRKGLMFLWGLALISWWIRYHPPGVDILVLDDDARQHVYWTARFQDPALFPDDLLTSFISSPVFDPPAYSFLYRLGVQVMDPLPFSQLVTLCLLLLSLWLLDLLSRELIPDRRGRFFLGCLFLFFSLYDASGGFPRTFAFPLFLLFLTFLQRGSILWAAGCLILQALFYPPILLNSLALAGWRLLQRLFRGMGDRKWMRDAVSLGLAALVTLLLLASVYGPKEREILGRQVTVEEARSMPEFHPEGRSKFFRDNLASYLLIGRSGIGLIHLIGFAIILGAMGLSAGLRSIRVPSLAVDLCWTSLVLFGAAHLLLFRLHLPSRYTLYTLPLALMLVIGASTGSFLETTTPFFSRIRERLHLTRRVGWGVFGLLLVTYVYIQGHYIARVDTQVAVLEPVDMDMLNFLKTLPKEALVAGHPLDMNNVPLIARRKVLANQELSIPYYLGYYTQIRQRLFDLFQAYYATTWETVHVFVDRYGVDALVLRKAHFEPSFLRGKIYAEPFDRAVKERWNGKEPFVLQAPPPNLRCFENERYIVLCFQDKGRASRERPLSAAR
jgi:hypothetical protein